MRAEGHDRLASPLYSLAFALIALTAVLTGEFNRRGRRWRIVLAVGCIALLRGAGLGLVGLSAKIPALIPLLYLNIALVMAICLYALMRGGMWPHRWPDLRHSGAGPV